MPHTVLEDCSITCHVNMQNLLPSVSFFVLLFEKRGERLFKATLISILETKKLFSSGQPEYYETLTARTARPNSKHLRSFAYFVSKDNSEIPIKKASQEPK